MRQHTQQGMTLIELMTALAIGAFLMLGAVTVFMQSRTTFRINESLARMQETARFAIDALEPEIRMAGYWGLTSTATNILDRTAPIAANGFGKNLCGTGGLLTLDLAVAGTNNGYGFTCAGVPTPVPESNSDTLVVRRAAEDFETPPLSGVNTRRIQTVRGTGESRAFTGEVPPFTYDPDTNEIHRLFVNGFYVNRTSTVSAAGNQVPSLKVQTLLASGSIQNQEVIPGVEDLQIQFGVDTDAPGTADRGSIDRYVNPNDPMIDPGNADFNPNAEILAVRVWIRVRAEREERGYTNDNAYIYADRNAGDANVGPFNDGFRRLVVSKTIYLRNARPAS
jgi:type IV pilus assembly protein PilW